MMRRPHGAPRRWPTRPNPASRRGVELAVICLALAAMAGAACNGRVGRPGGEQTTTDDEGQVRTLDVFALGRQLGTVAPCGCTTEPLGGLAYLFGFVEHNSRPGARLVIEPGSFLFPDPAGPEAPRDEADWAQAERRAALLHTRFSALGTDLVSGLGPTDLVSPSGTAALERYALPRVLSNAADPAALPATVATHRSLRLDGDVRVAVLAIVDPGLGGGSLPPLLEPIAALGPRVSELRADHELLVVSVMGPRALAEAVARELPVDLVIAGGPATNVERGRTGHPSARVGHAFVLEPGEQGQTLAHVRVHVPVRRGETAITLPTASAWKVAPSRAQQEAELARIDERLARFRADPTADAQFIANLERERQALADGLAQPTRVGTDVEVVLEQVKVTCHRPSDEAARAALTDYAAWVSSENQRRFAGIKTPEPDKGKPTYVGIEECATCHEEAYAQWKGTRHAHAYATLVTDEKQFDLSCASCHVTGWRKPGGAELVETRGLVDVQCEQCHGPGSLHSADPDHIDLPAAIGQEVCGQCHTPEHSDTFAFEAYLRDVLGPGHGAEARARLGDGPTGRELREAGFAKAGGACKKM